MSGKIPWLVSLIGSLATAELLLSQRPASQFQSSFLGSSTSVRVFEEVKPEFDKFQQTTKPDL